MTNDPEDNVLKGKALKGKSLKGRVALITGCSSGIGRATALALAAIGCEVIATMRNPKAGEDLLRQAQAKNLSLRVERLDLDDPSSINIPGNIDILISNAAVQSEWMPVEEISLDNFRAVFETNVMGTMYLLRATIPKMRAKGSGLICLVTSTAYMFGLPFQSAYMGSKMAISGIATALRAELMPHNIRVVEGVPGAVATRMAQETVDTPLAALNCPAYLDTAEKVHQQVQHTMDFAVPPEETAAGIVALIEDEDLTLRRGLDRGSRSVVKKWRADSEALARDYLKQLGVLPEQGHP